jgi:hypothetical protein
MGGYRRLGENSSPKDLAGKGGPFGHRSERGAVPTPMEIRSGRRAD